MRGTLMITCLLLSLSIYSGSNDATQVPAAAATTAASTAARASTGTTPSTTVQVASTIPSPTSKKPITGAPSVGASTVVTKPVTTTQQPTSTVQTLPPTTSTSLTAALTTQSTTSANTAPAPAPASTAPPAVYPSATTITSNTMTVASTNATSQATVAPTDNSPQSTTAAESNKGTNATTEQPGGNADKTTKSTGTPAVKPSVGVTSKNIQTSTARKENSNAGPTATMTTKGLSLTGSTKSSQSSEMTFTSSQTSTGKDSHPTTKILEPRATTPAGGNEVFEYSPAEPESNKNKTLVELCKRFMSDLRNGTCFLTLQNNGRDLGSLKIEVKASRVQDEYLKITRKKHQELTDSKTLIAILASCGALLIMIIIFGVCVSHRRKPYNENQQHLTEELHTVENGYHDNPTLEVMEVQPEMQEKKMVLNGEFSDSWIVPIDNLMKEDMLDEEDTHL